MQRKEKVTATISRRHFLKSTGIAAGVSSLGPFLPAVARLKRDPVPLKMGVLLPRSKFSQTPAKSLLAGMHLRLKQAQSKVASRPAVLEIREIGFGAVEAARASRDLIETQGVDLIVALASSTIAGELRDLLQEKKTFLLVVNAGANVVRTEDSARFVFHCSLNCWQTNAALGEWATQNIGKQAFVAASFHDSGYDLLHAFEAGVVEKGGSVIQICVTGAPTAMSPQQVVARIAASQPDFVYASFTGNEATDFALAYRNAGLMARIPLVCSEFTKRDLLRSCPEAAVGIITATSWPQVLKSQHNQHFVDSFQVINGIAPDPFAVLGFDAARLIEQALSVVAGDSQQTEALRVAFANVQFLSPRGFLRMDTRDHCLQSHSYIQKVRLTGGSLTTEIVAEDVGPRDWRRTGLSLAAGVKTGWLNPYRCV